MTVTLLLPRILLGDPHDCPDAADELCILGAIYDTLVRREGTEFLPALALSWEVSQDARTWRFTLREGVRFHDGTACDAAAVQASMERMAREDRGYTLGAPAVWRQYLEGARYEARGCQLTITLRAPMADFLDVLVQGFIAAPAACAQLDAGDGMAHLGTGPYRLLSRSEDEILLQASGADHWPLPVNAVLRIARESDPAARLAAVADGTARFAAQADPAAQAAGATLLRYRAPVAIIYLLNAARGPLRDARVRRALSLAVDRAALVQEVMAGQAEPLHGFVSPAHFGADPAAPMPHDPALARQLLAEAGHGGGLVLTADCPTRLPDEAEHLNEALTRQLAEVGIRLERRLHHDREAYAHMVRRKEIRDLCVFDSSPMSTFRVLYEKIDSRVGGAWWQGYQNPAVEALLDQARVTTDTAARAALFREIYRGMQADPPWLTLYNPIRAVALAGRHPGLAWPADGVPDLRRLPALAGTPNG